MKKFRTKTFVYLEQEKLQLCIEIGRISANLPKRPKNRLLPKIKNSTETVSRNVSQIGVYSFHRGKLHRPWLGKPTRHSQIRHKSSSVSRQGWAPSLSQFRQKIRSLSAQRFGVSVTVFNPVFAVPLNDNALSARMLCIMAKQQAVISRFQVNVSRRDLRRQRDEQFGV